MYFLLFLYTQHPQHLLANVSTLTGLIFLKLLHYVATLLEKWMTKQEINIRCVLMYENSVICTVVGIIMMIYEMQQRGQFCILAMSNPFSFFIIYEIKYV